LRLFADVVLPNPLPIWGGLIEEGFGSKARVGGRDTERERRIGVPHSRTPGFGEGVSPIDMR
jgi:hypothetical protein